MLEVVEAAGEVAAVTEWPFQVVALVATESRELKGLLPSTE